MSADDPGRYPARGTRPITIGFAGDPELEDDDEGCCAEDDEDTSSNIQYYYQTPGYHQRAGAGSVTEHSRAVGHHPQVGSSQPGHHHRLACTSTARFVASSTRQGDQHVPRLAYLFNQNPAISASLPNYAESRALLGSHVIDSGSLDYSVEEPLSLPAVSMTTTASSGLASQLPSSSSAVSPSSLYLRGGQHQHHQHHHQQHQQRMNLGTSSAIQTAFDTGRRGSQLLQGRSFIASASASAGEAILSGYQWGVNVLRSQLGSSSGATTAEPMPSSSLASSASISYRSSSNATGSSAAPLSEPAQRGHSAFMSASQLVGTSSHQGSLANRRHQLDQRGRPIFQKSSSTPNSHGHAQRHGGISPPPVPMRRPQAPFQPAAAQQQQHRHSTQHQRAAHDPRYQDLVLPHMLGRLELGEHQTIRDEPYLLQQQQHLQHHQHPSHLQRRLLPQIPRHPNQSPPSELASAQPLFGHAAPQTHPQHAHKPSDVERIYTLDGAGRRRRQSSLELERQQQQQLGLAGLSVMELESPPPIGPHRSQLRPALGQPAPVPPPTISVSPEFTNSNYPILHLSGYGSDYQYPFAESRPKDHRYISASAEVSPYRDYSAYTGYERPYLAGQSVYATPRAVRETATHRSMAMGSDSELNTRGLSSNKLYYVHVPPARRPRRNRALSGAIQVHQEQAHQLAHHQQQPLAQQAHRPQPELPKPLHGSQPTASARAPNQHQMMVETHAPATRPGKGVTFDGRTSAPVYGRRSRQTELRDSYLRTNSEEYPVGGQVMLSEQLGGQDESEENEERSSSLASRASAGSYSRQKPSALTASEFNLGANQGQSSADHPARERRPSRGPEFPASQTPINEGASSASRHHSPGASRDKKASTLATFQEVGSLSDTGGHTSLSDKEQPQHQQSGGSGSRSGQVARSHSNSAETPPSRSERRARVRDSQQSSNERSFGEATAVGSSQSLKSQSGGLGASGGFSKKSNSTTQLSLSGKHRPLTTPLGVARWLSSTSRLTSSFHLRVYVCV